MSWCLVTLLEGKPGVPETKCIKIYARICWLIKPADIGAANTGLAEAAFLFCRFLLALLL